MFDKYVMSPLFWCMFVGVKSRLVTVVTVVAILVVGAMFKTVLGQFGFNNVGYAVQLLASILVAGRIPSLFLADIRNSGVKFVESYRKVGAS
ncbi:hypothetical protein [Vibrio crassostreae]|uniref:hypothetical protein n=1 Tax=Vibrio crassostreae TaxID=246167 RepID=UPI001B308C9B|nr:hypothetical protein [Vibrio crassostreae]